MLYDLLVPLADYHIIFNLFRYITFRSAGAMATALVLSARRPRAASPQEDHAHTSGDSCHD